MSLTARYIHLYTKKKRLERQKLVIDDLHAIMDRLPLSKMSIVEKKSASNSPEMQVAKANILIDHYISEDAAFVECFKNHAIKNDETLLSISRTLLDDLFTSDTFVEKMMKTRAIRAFLDYLNTIKVDTQFPLRQIVTNRFIVSETSTLETLQKMATTLVDSHLTRHQRMLTYMTAFLDIGSNAISQGGSCRFNFRYFDGLFAVALAEHPAAVVSRIASLQILPSISELLGPVPTLDRMTELQSIVFGIILLLEKDDSKVISQVMEDIKMEMWRFDPDVNLFRRHAVFTSFFDALANMPPTDALTPDLLQHLFDMTHVLVMSDYDRAITPSFLTFLADEVATSRLFSYFSEKIRIAHFTELRIGRLNDLHIIADHAARLYPTSQKEPCTNVALRFLQTFYDVSSFGKRYTPIYLPDEFEIVKPAFDTIKNLLHAEQRSNHPKSHWESWATILYAHSKSVYNYLKSDLPFTETPLKPCFSTELIIDD